MFQSQSQVLLYHLCWYKYVVIKLDTCVLKVIILFMAHFIYCRNVNLYFTKQWQQIDMSDRSWVPQLIQSKYFKYYYISFCWRLRTPSIGCQNILYLIKSVGKSSSPVPHQITLRPGIVYTLWPVPYVMQKHLEVKFRVTAW
jgi:hypothetical protein